MLFSGESKEEKKVVKGEKPDYYQCEHCEYRSTDTSNMKKYVIRKHGKMDQTIFFFSLYCKLSKFITKCWHAELAKQHGKRDQNMGLYTSIFSMIASKNITLRSIMPQMRHSITRKSR